MQSVYRYQQVDTLHLPFPFVETPFTVSAAHWVRLFEACHYSLHGEKILLGIRGAIPVSSVGVWHKEIVLQEVIPDHKTLKCTLGILDRKTAKMAIFNASTVPHLHHVSRQYQQPESRLANLLASGCYDYFVGAHEPEHRPKEEGAFRLSRLGQVAVWRLFQNHSAPVFDICIPDDHIHAAAETVENYHSAGCQVISGTHAAPALPEGQYQQFRILAGQSLKPNMDELMIPYQYVLTHARHLYAIHAGYEASCLFYGSVGREVRMVQEQLMTRGLLKEGRYNKGHMSGESLGALYEFQVQAGLRPSGIGTEETRRHLASVIPQN